jgi:hypothetical protein
MNYSGLAMPFSGLAMPCHFQVYYSGLAMPAQV